MCITLTHPYDMGNYDCNSKNGAKRAKQLAQNTVDIKRSNFKSQALDCEFLSMSLPFS